ncbi:alpha-glucosidase/alpha-galactosidase (plasmid) [Deinococcus psychrotolerans]|uniref:Alpha-glucosidase/alpha-galactosidase n=1 Tax=Deinococcus psychrotolerans TaxID=2489213 RepID=A0A3G8YIL5_9DEIO|nr:alpha-glucosidase/alpha-galactosidase [Deinococcus psychrotolerans]AZI44813.1 alpha-glucosidase/alpha-galactosidase [Deinococcus psychrotolerans]
MTKIAIIGAGSAVFAQQMITDVLAIDGLDTGEFALIDIDPVRLEQGHELAELTVKRSGKLFTVTSSTNRLELLPGTDFVINTIEVSGLGNVRHDYDIPMNYGVDQCIGDTTGPGGVMKFLRTAPAWLGILRDIERLAPQAVVMSYTNPMSALVLLSVRASSLKVYGLCHSIQNTLAELAGYLNLPAAELTYRCAGVNHLSWFTELGWKGQDVMPKLRAAMLKPEIYEQDIIRFEMLKHFGAFPTESSGHFSEYVPYFRKRPDLLAQFTRPEYKGESGFYAHNWPRWRDEHQAQVADLIAREKAGETAIDMTRSPEFASNIIEGMVLDRPQQITCNLPNTRLIDNLSQDGVVEVGCTVDAQGIHPQPYGRLPEALAALNRSHMAVHSLLADSVIQENHDLAVQALMLDPLTAAVCSLDEIRAMFAELVEVEQADLPSYLRESVGV